MIFQKTDNMKLTIITICYNDKEGLVRTLKSVECQTCKDFQYIIIDGASTDGSVELLKQYTEMIDYQISEKDNGIYNAMNKGIKQAQGEYCLFLNAGDSLCACDTIEKVHSLLGGADFVSGDTICTFSDGHTSVWRAVNQVTTYLMAIYSLSHQATFIRTNLLKQRPYREDLRIVSDWEQMFYELIICDRSYKRIEVPICEFAQGGISSSQKENRERERQKVLDEHFSKRMQLDIVHPALLVRIATLADIGTNYYRILELAARVIRKTFVRK